MNCQPYDNVCYNDNIFNVYIASYYRCMDCQPYVHVNVSNNIDVYLV